MALISRSRSQLLAGLTVALAAAFGLAVWQTGRAQHERVRSAVCFYAASAARQLLARARVLLHATADPVFAGIGGQAPLPSSAPLPSPAALEATARSLADCHCAPFLPARAYFRADAPDGPVTVVHAAGDGSGIDTAAIRHALTAGAAVIRAAGVAALPVTERWDPRAALHDVIIVAPKYAPNGDLRAIYGIAMAPSTFAATFVAPIFQQVSLFPRELTERGTLPNSSFVSYRVTDYGGGALDQSAEQFSGCVETAVPDPAMASVRLSLRATPATAERWAAVGTLPSRLPILATLLFATLGCGAAAAVVGAREAELARLRSDFVTGVSHELRMPLAQILLFGETLSLGRARSDAARADAAHVIVRETNRLTGLVENILYFSRVEHHNIEVTPIPVCLATFVEAVLTMMRPLADDAGTTIVARIDPHLEAMLDQSSFKQVLFNLLDNALKYGRRGQCVRIGAEATAADRVRLWVDDQGPGIPPADAKRIFSPFVRLDRDRQSAIGGSGLGLAVVHDIVALHDGTVWVESTSDGHARFVMELPRPRGTPGPP
jgi:signal transduction histidine kinase